MKLAPFFILLLFASVIYAQPAGSLDPSFGVAGKVTVSFTSGQDKAYGVAIQADGKILVAGYASSNITGKDFACLRLKENGTRDSTFGIAGLVTIDVQLGSEDIAYGIALQADGKIVLAGYSDDGSDKDAAIVRLLDDGSIDVTFGTQGKVLTDFENGKQDEIKVVRIHPLTGNIIVGGAAIINASTSKPVVARYLSSGSLDSTFNSNGIRLMWITSLDYQYLFSVEDLVVQANGKISATGWRDFTGLPWDSDFWAARINSDGSMDNTFSGDGVSVYNGSFNGYDKGYALLLRSNNNILIAGGGYETTLYYDFATFELNADGSTAPWYAIQDFGETLDDIAYGMLEDNNGRFVLGGSSGSNTNKTFALTRLQANAALDNSFGTNSKVTTTFGSNMLQECFDIGLQNDNKIVAAGYAGNDFAVARYLGDAVPQLDDFNLISPFNNAINQNFASLNLDWSNAFGATSYEVEIDSSLGFSTGPQTFTVSNSAKTLTNLVPLTDYYWHVRATDGSNWGQWSGVWKFTTKTDAVGIANTIDRDAFAVFPNPTHDIVTIQSPISLSGKEFRLEDIAGRLVLKGVFRGVSPSISLVSLPRGIYFLRVGMVDGMAWKIVKE
ncbi:MAG: T9SS type A sorting domain-containing protein [Bacteroidetes bacterium]|nr:T9SS type A sorting domain-containing protein [Bacteroidota bacterium]